MQTCSAIDRLELLDVITDDGHQLVHVYIDRFFQGAIHEADDAWRGKLHPVDLGDFRTLDEARAAVADWFSALDTGAETAALDEGTEREGVDPCDML